MIVEDHRDQVDLDLRGEAIWEYIVNTLDPVVKNTLVSDDNYFYLLCLQGKYSQRYDILSTARHLRYSSYSTIVDATRSTYPIERTANFPSQAFLMGCASTPTSSKKSFVGLLQAP